MELFMQGNDTIHERYLIFREQKERLQKQIDELQKMMDIVDYKCWYFEEAEKRGDIDFYKKLPPDEVDERIWDFGRKVNDFRKGSK